MDATFTTERLHAALKAAIAHASTDDTRPHFCGVLVSGESAPDIVDVVATDGYTLAKLRIRTVTRVLEHEGVSALIPLAEAQRLLQALKHKRAAGHLPVRLVIGPNTGYMALPDARIDFALSDEEFPAFDAVIPGQGTERSDNRHAATAAGAFGADARYMERACKVARDFLGTHQSCPGLRISAPETSLSPIRIDFGAPDAGEGLIVIMPIRL